MEKLNTIGQRLKHIRTQLSKTQVQFSELFEMTRENYGKIEIDKRYPSIEMQTILLNKFNINLNWLITGSGKMKLTDEPEMVVNEPKADYAVKVWKELAEERKERIEELKAELDRLKSEKEICKYPAETKK